MVTCRDRASKERADTTASTYHRRRPAPCFSKGAPELKPTDITDQFEKGGPAFGSFVKSIGLAVAEAQQNLDENLVKTAKALSETQIDVIAVFEQQINDETGEMDKGTPHVQKLPLVNYLMPTAYQWSRVHLESDMEVSEFSAANSVNIRSKSEHSSAGVSGSYGLFGGGIRGHFGFGQSSSETAVGTESATSSSAGKMRMEATLEPRGDIRLLRHAEGPAAEGHRGRAARRLLQGARRRPAAPEHLRRAGARCGRREQRASAGGGPRS